MTVRNKFIIDEDGILNKELEKLSESKDTEKILRTLEVLRDKAAVTSGNQKFREIFWIEQIVGNNANNYSIIEQSFETVQVLCTEGEKFCNLYGSDTKLQNTLESEFGLFGLEEKYPQLKRFIDQTREYLEKNAQYCDNEKYAEQVSRENKEEDIDKAWKQHKIDELRARKKAEKNTQKEIGEYRKSRIGRQPTTLDFVVKNLKKKSNTSKE